jgi:hypothetical protein
VRRQVQWRGEDGDPLAEAADVDLEPAGVRATGVQLGTDPLPYRLDYELDASAGWITARLRVDVHGEGWSRALDLRHDGDGHWAAEASARGDADLPDPGGHTGPVSGALDCDLGLSSMTNLMPIRRHGLQERPGAAEILTAWVSVPDLALIPYEQRYEHVARRDAGAVVRFISLGVHAGFTADLEVDRDGLVIAYPQIARRVSP